jgi:preprotein translocase SecE subunit
MSVTPKDWFNDGREYLDGIRGEYDKITWPAQKEAVAGTIGVVAVVAIVTTVLSIVDFLLSRIVQVVLG